MTDLAQNTEETQSPRRPRRWRRLVTVTLVVLIVLLGGVVGGAGWYFSGEVVNVTHGEYDYPVTVAAVNGTEVTLPVTDETTRPGVWGLHWPEGRALLGDVLRIEDGFVVRPIQRILYGTLTAGTATRIDLWAVGEDPETAFGIPYETVDIDTELGGAPAWYVPADGDTWVIAVHGRNAGPREALRIIPTLHAAGMPVLSITHRNDEGAPASPDGLHHLGDTEWRDVAAAVDYAVAAGASDVVLYGWSMGGAVVMTAARRMDDRDLVSGVILDSPVLDWGSTLDKQGAQRSVPAPIVTVAKWLVEWRVDLDLTDLDQRRFAAEVAIPILLFADLDDETVDVAASLEFAEAVDPALMTLVTTTAGHTASWNENPAGYESAVTKFVTDR
ncbi:hypothetical protein FB566_1512 [Stackebrandtia endophytica]|uniref:Peptidase S9 prolyl oligopeptidase catalytic domain-containing protein n=1 Tax=Stackebrandtia endophytica TaxID=1496996 RepID=A0A543ATU9_9ACTN|nr:alpha/beta hydrolase [Stackebrandtia endophytica]TQL75992.1 hypothetical protein FB566_1512 [Stackebrandtia endophytica]